MSQETKQCCMPTDEEKALLAAGDYTPEELWGGSRPTCPKCIDAPEYFVAACDKFDWTPEEALRFYAEGKHFDTVDGRTRILCTGAIASHALKGLAGPYADMKGIEPAGNVEVLRYGLFNEFVCVLPDDLDNLEAHVTRLTAENNLLRHDVASFLETMAKTCELLGIDLESAKSAEDKPSDVLFEHAKRLAAERDRHAHNSKEWESASLHWMAEYDKVKSELTKARELLNRASGQLEVCAFGLREIATSKRVTALNLRQMAKSTLNSAAGIADQSTPAAKPLLVECDVCPTSGGCVESCMKAPAAQHEDK